ncbi:MAG: DNRLRE domain-containing protein [Archaeoglobaceae archaeon]
MNTKAVSPLIGFILLMAIVMGAIGILQSTAVPQWNKAVEAKHFNSLKYEVADISEVVAISASTGAPAKVVLKAGVDYPNYYVLISPPKASTTISAKSLQININGTPINVSDNTSAIIVEPNYFYSSRTKLIYEHSAVLRLENSGVLEESRQSSFSNNSISIYIIRAKFNNFATTESASLILVPVSVGGRNVFSGDISFECFDESTAEWWNSTLKSIYNNSDVEISRNGNVVEIKNLKNITLSISVFEAYALTSGEVSLTPPPRSYRLTPITSTTIFDVYLHSTIPLGAKVVDEYGNPARNVTVGIIDPCNDNSPQVSDERGEVWYYFNANCSGTQTVSFRVDGSTQSFTITVHSVTSTTGEGAFEIEWYKDSNLITNYDWNVSEIGNETDFFVRVVFTTFGIPAPGVPVYFVLNNTSVLSIASKDDKTNSTGWAKVNLTALENGTVAIAAIVADSFGVLNITVTNAGLANRPPTQPSISTDKKYYRVGETITATAYDSTDPDGDPITYYYKFYDLSNGIILQDWSTTNTYTITNNEEGHVIRVYAKACDDKNACSPENYTDVGVIKVIEIRDQSMIFDSYVSSRYSNTNYGTSTLLYAGYSTTLRITRTFIKFALPSELNNVKILNATLYLYKSGQIGSPTAIKLQAHRVLADWSETTIKWNNQPPFSQTPTNSITPPTTNLYLGWNVTSDVQAFVDGTPNYGWCIKSSNENLGVLIRFNSKENAANRPYLRIEYAPRVD